MCIEKGLPVWQRELLRVFHPVKMLWSKMNEDERSEAFEGIILYLRRMRRDHRGYGQGKIMFTGIFRQLANMLMTSEGEERDNLIVFMSRTAFFKQLSRICGSGYWNSYDLDYQLLAGFFNAIPEEKECEKTLIACRLYGNLPEAFARLVKTQVCVIKSSLENDVMVDALFSGCIRYDETVYQKFCDWIDRLEEEELNAPDPANPVYVIACLYIWGYMEVYDLKRFMEKADRSEFLRVLTDPQHYSWKDFRKECSILLGSREYLGCYEHYNKSSLRNIRMW